MKVLRAIGIGFAVLWMVTGVLHFGVMPFTDPERAGFHFFAGLAQAAIAYLLFSRLSASRNS